MKKTMFFVLAATTILLCSFTPVSTGAVVKVSKKMVVVGDESFIISTGVGFGAREFFLSVERVGNEAGDGNVDFDVDIMYNSSSSQVETHRITMYHGQTTLYQARQAYTVIGTDVEPVSDAYNRYYY